MKIQSFTAIVYKEDDMYITECPEVGTVDQGETIEQAIAGLKEATRLYLEEFPLPQTSPRFVTNIEVSSIALFEQQYSGSMQTSFWSIADRTNKPDFSEKSGL
jgi:predicted RNase H-like HicB family nuclease